MFILDAKEHFSSHITVQCNYYFENIRFDFSKASGCTEGSIHLSTAHKLWCKACAFQFCDSPGIMARVGSDLTIESCSFDGASTAIELSPCSGNVAITDSSFKHCGRASEYVSSSENACIQIFDDYDDMSEKSFVQLRCEGNVFENNLCYPIAERLGQRMYGSKTSLYSLSNNTLKGYNATEVRKGKQVDDANRIYFNDEKERFT